MTHEIIEAIKEGKPFDFGDRMFMAIPYDNTLDDVCFHCDEFGLCDDEIRKLCSEINDTFLDCMYLTYVVI